MFTHHGTIIPVQEQVLRQLCTTAYTPSWRPVVAGAAHVYPSRDVNNRAVDKNGIALVDIRAQLTALWSQSPYSWLYMTPSRADSSTPPQQQAHLAAWPILPFSTGFIDAAALVLEDVCDGLSHAAVPA